VESFRTRTPCGTREQSPTSLAHNYYVQRACRSCVRTWADSFWRCPKFQDFHGTVSKIARKINRSVEWDSTIISYNSCSKHVFIFLWHRSYFGRSASGDVVGERSSGATADGSEGFSDGRFSPSVLKIRKKRRCRRPTRHSSYYLPLCSRQTRS